MSKRPAKKRTLYIQIKFAKLGNDIKIIQK